MVFTVPMRNWNATNSPNTKKHPPGFYSTYEELKPQINKIENKDVRQFLQYLWGIETFVY